MEIMPNRNLKKWKIWVMVFRWNVIDEKRQFAEITIRANGNFDKIKSCKIVIRKSKNCGKWEFKKMLGNGNSVNYKRWHIMLDGNSK